MNNNNYISFLKWFFMYTNDGFPEKITNYSFRRPMIRKERLPILIFSYILLILSFIFCVITVFSNNGDCWLAILGIISSIMWLLQCEFSFTYYFIAYIKSKNKDKSINDSVIFQYGVLDGGESELFSMISNHFTPYVKMASPFSVKITLLAKGRTLRKKTSHIKKVLKITPNKVYFNRKIIFHKKLLDLADLEKFLIEEANNWN